MMRGMDVLVGLVFDLSRRSVLVVVVGCSSHCSLTPVHAAIEREEHVEEEDRVQSFGECQDEGPAVGTQDGIK